LRFNNLSTIDKIRTIIVLTLLSTLIWAVNYQTAQEVLKPRILHIEIAHAEMASTQIEEKAASSVNKSSQEVIETSSRGVKPLGEAGIIKEAARKNGIDWKILYAIFQKESQGDCTRIGDTHLKNASYGCFQINLGYHPTITPKQASDINFSANWTAERLKKNEWRGESEMIRSHNGLVSNHSNDWYVDDVYNIISTL
jgi:hypothetical protein